MGKRKGKGRKHKDMFSINQIFRKELGKTNFEISGRSILGEIGLHRIIMSSWWIDPVFIINIPLCF